MKDRIPRLRCPKHDEWFSVRSRKDLDAKLTAFMQKHQTCGQLEGYEGQHLNNYLTPKGSQPS